jgi:hypothetical protein
MQRYVKSHGSGNLIAKPCFIRVIRSRIVRRAATVAHIREMRIGCRNDIVKKKKKEENHLAQDKEPDS